MEDFHSYKRWYDIANKPRISGRAKSLKQKYGITLKDYQNLWDAQMGECASCGDPLEKSWIDHDHRYGNNWWAVRGLLCPNCNLALGHLKDDIERINRLAAYVAI